MELERAYKAIESKAGIQIRVYLTDGCRIFSSMPVALERSPSPEIIGSIVVLLQQFGSFVIKSLNGSLVCVPIAKT